MRPQKDNCPRSAATTWWSQDYNQARRSQFTFLILMLFCFFSLP